MRGHASSSDLIFESHVLADNVYYDRFLCYIVL